MGIIEATPDPLEADHLAEDLRRAQALLVRGHHHMPACVDAGNRESHAAWKAYGSPLDGPPQYQRKRLTYYSQ